MARRLHDMIYVWQNLKERAIILADMEHEGDAITHNIMRLLYRSFVVPFDSEDIAALANSLDNVADLIHITADTLYRYKIESPTDKARELGDLILQAVLEVSGGVSELNINIRQPELRKRCVAINEIENSGDKVYNAAIAELFHGSNDFAHIIKWRDVYKSMESTIDRCEDCADILEGIGIKAS